MKKVIFIEQPKEETKKPVEFTHYLDGAKGFVGNLKGPKDFTKIVYLGKCNIDGDMFAAYIGGDICLYKGHLNSGEY